MKLLLRLVQMAVLWVAFQAIREQLSLPPEERTWHGHVGPVPYDFRPPNWDRLRDAYWNPDSDRLFTDRVLGIGWAINFAHLLRIARELREQGDELMA